MSEGTPTPIDGIQGSTAVAPAAPSAHSTPSVHRIATAALFSIAVLAVLYVFAGLFFLSLFPRSDGSLEQLKSLLTVVFGAGGLAWFLLCCTGFMRLASTKGHRRQKMLALIRITLVLLPTVSTSIAVPLLITRPPTLFLEVMSPSSPQDLLAPVTVTFGMTTAQKFFAVNRLTPLKYEWDFNGDGKVDQESFDPTASFIYFASGIYGVECVVTMTNGQREQLRHRLVVPRASFGVVPEKPVVDEPASFSLQHLFPQSQNSGDQSPKVTKASWDFDGDGVVDLESDKLTVATTYRKIGRSTPSVNVTLSNQTQTTFRRTVEVVKAQEQPFPISLETEPATLLASPPFGVLFTLKTKEPIASASWDFGNGKTAEGLRVAQVFNTAGSYSVSVAARSQSGATARLVTVVRVAPQLAIPDLEFDGSPDVRGFTVEGQVPLTVHITPATAQPLISFSWDAGTTGEILASDKTFHAVYRDAGTYYADLIAVDPDENVFRKRLKIIAQPPKSFVNFTMDPETPTAPATVVFDASDTFVPNDEISGFEWDFGDGSNAATKFAGARVQHDFVRTGTYTVKLTVRTTSGKVYSSNKTLLVRSALLDACFLPSRRSGKAPLGVRFDTDCSTGVFNAWIWDFGDSSASDIQHPTHVFEQPGEYTVTLTAKTKDGQTMSKSTTISVTQ